MREPFCAPFDFVCIYPSIKISSFSKTGDSLLLSGVSGISDIGANGVPVRVMTLLGVLHVEEQFTLVLNYPFGIKWKTKPQLCSLNVPQYITPPVSLNSFCSNSNNPCGK